MEEDSRLMENKTIEKEKERKRERPTIEQKWVKNIGDDREKKEDRMLNGTAARQYGCRHGGGTPKPVAMPTRERAERKRLNSHP